MIQLVEVKKLDDAIIQEFKLVRNDNLFECCLDDKKIGYAVIRQKVDDRIFLIIAEDYQNKGYGSEAFKLLLEMINDEVICSVPFDNAKMQRIIEKNKGIEIGRNGKLIKYIIQK